jgi:hypothetical protein
MPFPNNSGVMSEFSQMPSFSVAPLNQNNNEQSDLPPVPVGIPNIIEERLDNI